VHPPRFHLNQRLDDWPRCSVELHCCRGAVVYPVVMLRERCGNITFANLLARLRCEKCRRFQPAPVYLWPGAACIPGALRRIGLSN
jgi:hypothetical protein